MTPVDDLYASLNQRWRPERVIALIATMGNYLDDETYRTARTLERHSSGYWMYSSMPEEFETRGPDLEKDLAHANNLLCYHHPSMGDLLSSLRYELFPDGPGTPASREFRIKYGRRLYNRHLRLYNRLADKYIRHDKQQKMTDLLKSTTGLAHLIPRERFIAAPREAMFIAYFTATRRLRREFSLHGRRNPYDNLADALLNNISQDGDWGLVAHAMPRVEILQKCQKETAEFFMPLYYTQMKDAALLMEEAYRSFPEDFIFDTMVVRKGMDSSTWNTMAGAYNQARASWINALTALGGLNVLDVSCPGKAMRLIAADLYYWHQRSDGDVDPATKIFAALPRPWDVLNGTPLSREETERVCREFGVDPDETGWTGPRAATSIAEFTPTPELVHGVSIADPMWAKILRDAGIFSGSGGRKFDPTKLPESVPDGLIVSDLPSRPPLS